MQVLWLLLFLFNFCVLFSTWQSLEANALSYDYTATVECLRSPFKPQYGGGIIVNPELNYGLTGWTTFGAPKVQHRELNGNKFIVAHGRNQSYDSVSQNVYLRKNRHYTFSAWIQLSQGSGHVTAIFKTTSGFKYAGAVIAESKCWSMLKGGFTTDESGPVDLYFEAKTPVDVWVDSVSLQPFTEKQWKSHQDQSTEEARKAKVRIQAVDKQGNPLPNATISIKQNRPGFPFGCAINKNILSNTAYQNWFTSNPFTVTTFENEMKWYSNEPSRGHVDYSVADAMLKFAQQHSIEVRGHNVFWDDPRYQPSWLNSLSPSEIYKAAKSRVYSIMSRYKEQVIAWDIVNENLHFNLLESKIGPSASSIFYCLAHAIDRKSTMFMNEFNTIEDNRDPLSSPARYLQMLRVIKSFPCNRNLHMGIGLESHFDVPNLPYMRASIDTLAAANLPIWLTEVDVQSSPNQARYLEQILREAYSHPKVSGIVIWAAWDPKGCYRMCLTDNNFRNLPTGDVVESLLHEWGAMKPLLGTTDADGFFEISLFHGDYHVQIIDHSTTLSSSSMFPQSLKVAPNHASESTLLLQLT
ncbi:hypothetical protein K2173_002228 [Erythroxylum novogranatense]|uniref:GH10 domain-containing protein n=1 Tax=Erythroxylum novogranatense TaxID=1862640 RepID=A0AAV8T9B3_9ROSI|nr:hypothetical protein K2173_002228 [Erythroxylum novogranatense]